MQTNSNANFGPLVAYLVPGATALFDASQLSPTLRAWFAATPPDSPTIGGFLYLTVASLAAGMSVNAIRWAVVDHIHAWTGLPMPKLDFSKLGSNVEAFVLLIEIHCHHYQHHANMFVATAVAYASYRISIGSPFPLGRLDLGFLLVEVVFFATSRDCLKKYYSRGQQLLSSHRCLASSASSR